MTLPTNDLNLGMVTATQIPGVFTLATLPAISGVPAGTYSAWTTDGGLRFWDGISSWVAANTGAGSGVTSLSSPDGSLTIANPTSTPQLSVNASNISTGILPTTRGGTGVNNPTGVTAGTGVIVTGTFPNQVVSATGSTGLTLIYNDPSSASATANLNAIQAALTAGGLVNITGNGTVWINGSLIYSSYSALVCSPGTVVSSVAGSNVSMLKSSAEINFSAGGTAITLTQGVGCAVNVLLANHGLTTNQLYWISGANQPGYNGVGRIAAIVDANNFTIYTQKYQATAPTGTIIGVVAVQDFSLVGGQWNYNYPNNSGVTAPDSQCIRIIGTGDSYLEGVYVENASKFAFTLNAVHNVETVNCKWNNSHSDGAKVYGPSRSVRMRGCSGITGDDWISIQTRESSAFASAQLCYGDIFDIEVDGMVGVPQSSGNGIHLYPSDTEDFDMVHIKNMNTNYAGIVVGTVSGSGYTVGQMGNITFEKIMCTGNAASATNILLTQAYTIDSLLLRDVAFLPGSTLSGGANSLLSTSGTLGRVKNFTIERMKSNGIASSGNMNASFFAGTYQFDKMTFRDCTCVGTVTGGLTLATFAGVPTIGSLTFDNNRGDTGTKYMCSFSVAPAVAPVVKFVNNRWDGQGLFAMSTGTVGATVKLLNNELTGMSLGVLRLGVTATVLVTTDNTNTGLTAANLVANTGGTPKVALQGLDLLFDVSNALVDQTFTPQWANSTTAGTNKQGLAFKNNNGATNTWYSQGATNTLIL